jgi:hypothetical protein
VKIHDARASHNNKEIVVNNEQNAPNSEDENGAINAKATEDLAPWLNPTLSAGDNSREGHRPQG